jgi:hypothetical protein
MHDSIRISCIGLLVLISEALQIFILLVRLPALSVGLVNEPRHDKTNIVVGLRPAWIQTSLRIRAD